MTNKMAGNIKVATLTLSCNACIHINALSRIAHSRILTFVIEVDIKKMFSESLFDVTYNNAMIEYEFFFYVLHD